MNITIDNFDSHGPVDYSAALDAESPLRIHRPLNAPAEARFALVLGHGAPLVPVSGAHVAISRRDGAQLFTGYISTAPDYEYLGWQQDGPVYRYTVIALSDEFLLDRKRLAEHVTLTAKSAGACLKALTDLLWPGKFDTSAVQDGIQLPPFTADIASPWSSFAAEIATLARSCYRVIGGKIMFAAPGSTRHSLSESSPTFDPSALTLHSPDALVNDLVVVGNVEPAAYVKDYFLGDGLTLGFSLSHQPYTIYYTTLLDDEFTEFDPALWSFVDPSHIMWIDAGNLNVGGGTGRDSDTTFTFAQQVELGGLTELRHGEVTFTAASDGVIGGLYPGATSITGCFAGFRISPSGAQSTIRALVNGVVTGPTITTIAGHRYGLTTRLYSQEIFRTQQTFCSSRSLRGGAANAADVRLVLEVHDVDPANPGSLVTVSTILYDAVIPNAPGFCTYALLNSANLHCSIPFARILRAPSVEVRSAIPNGTYRTRLIGDLPDGAECAIYSTLDLVFYTQFVPAANETIVARYRGRHRALARIADLTSQAAHVRGDDNGIHTAVRRPELPAPRTSSDCDNAARSLLEDLTQQAWSGEYKACSDFFPGVVADVFPGDAISIDSPTRAASFDAIIRDVEFEATDPLNDRGAYHIKFSNDAAEPLGMQFRTTSLSTLPDLNSTVASPSPVLPADPSQAEITDVTSTTVSIDLGFTPASGFGVEVRRVDGAWGLGNDRNLIGRFTTRTFTVPRLSRKQDYYIRQYQNTATPLYSRQSAALHLDYPY